MSRQESDYRNSFIAEAMKVLGYVNRFSRGVYRVQNELEENGNGQASFNFSLITAFRVVENVSQKYFEEGFGGETAQEKPKKDPRKAQETSKKHPRRTIRHNPRKSRDYTERNGNDTRMFNG